MSKPVQDCRAAAALCLAKVTSGLSLSQQIPIFEQQVIERDQPLFRQLCYGVMRFYPKLIGIGYLLLKKPLKDKDSDILMLILLGIYQLQETRIPDHAAVSATVNASKALKKHWAKNLINGVLRQWQRNQEELLSKLSPAQQQSHPKWLHKKLTTAWPEHAQLIEDANNQHPPMCLRINALKVSRDNYLQLLNQQNITAQACEYSAQGIRLQQPLPVDRLPAFNQGHASVQDEAPQLSADLLALAPGQRVLDACCAPGGKTCHILEAEPSLAQLVALDIDQLRLQRVEENLNRLQLEATLISGDASQPNEWWDEEQFDRILLDAPCSATGVIRRNPDIKHHRRANDIEQLADLQLRILQALWLCLKPGGRLLYATCSVLPEENEQVIAQFCQQQSDVSHQPIEANWGILRPYGRQLFPQAEGHDGFYYAVLEKKS